MTNIAQLKEELTAQIAAANDLQKLEEARVTALGKKGRITDLMKSLGGMEPEERKNFGAKPGCKLNPKVSKRRGTRPSKRIWQRCMVRGHLFSLLTVLPAAFWRPYPPCASLGTQFSLPATATRRCTTPAF